MKKYINKIFSGVVLTSALILSSCGSDYLNVSPSESVETDQVYGTTTGLRSALNGIAKEMTTQQYYYGSPFVGESGIIRLYENLPSQNYNYNYYASGWSPLHNQTFHLRGTSIYDSYAWAYYYQLIVSANAIINHADDAEGTEDDKKFVKASALAFRAFAYEKLIHYYCYRWQDSNNGASRGLPLRLDESTNEIAASTLAETYQQIYKDLDESISLFGSTKSNRNASEVWIPNVNVAHAVYARAALTKQDYSKALEQAKLAREGFELMSRSDYQQGFCDPTSEWIFGSYGSTAENNWYWAFGTQGACNGYYATTQPTGAGTIGHELIERIPDNDVRKQIFITEDKVFPEFSEKLTLAKEKLAEARKSGSADLKALIADSTKWADSINAGVNQTYGIIGMGSGEAYDKAWESADSVIKAHNVKGKSAAYQSEYYYLDGQMKFWVNDQPGVGYVPFIRSSEMYLIEAEANYFLGNEAAAKSALEALNVVRNPEYTCNKTGKELFNEIKDYREVELWGEGFAWSDYKRWNIPVVRHSFAQGGNAHTAVAVTVTTESGNKWTWVVPNGEVDYNSLIKNQE
jgi:hypothetical protein